MKNNSNIYLSKELNVCQVRVDIIIAIYLYSNFRGYFGSLGWWLCFIIVGPTIYLLTYRNLGLGLQGLYSATNCVVTIMNKQQNKQKL